MSSAAMDVNMRDVAAGGGGDIDAIDDEDVLRQLVTIIIQPPKNTFNS